MADDERDPGFGVPGWSVDHLRYLLDLSRDEFDPEIARQAADAAQSLLKMPTLAVKRLSADLKQAGSVTRLTEAKVDQLRGIEHRANIDFYLGVAASIVAIFLAGCGLRAHWFGWQTAITLAVGGPIVSFASRLRSGGAKKET